jgi:hypothetical protein
MNDAPERVMLSLIAHTNVGKTTLARTLLRREVGEVLDQPHVTEVSEAHALSELPDGERLLLWDTPGFGDTARLLRRLKISGNPIGWVLTQVWDRFTDRPFWCSQQAIRNVRDEADVVLYLVNSAEDPAGADYVELEMEILEWLQKPVLVLLNQTGPPRNILEMRTEEQIWERRLSRFGQVRGVLSLDAFTRCWIQEHVLLERIERLLPAENRAVFQRLKQEWTARNWRVFDESMKVLARQLARAVGDREYLEERSLMEKFRRILVREPLSDKERAMALLAERLSVNIATGTDELIKLHSLDGKAAVEILEQLQNNYCAAEPFDEGMATLIGGCISGAITGLSADFLAGGFTLGGGAVVGAILGAVGAKGLALGYNFVRGEQKSYIRCSAQLFQALVRSALLRYLAVAHFGRGRGEFVETERPKFWQAEVASAVERQSDAWLALWKEAGNQPDSPELSKRIQHLTSEAAREIFRELYPDESRERGGNVMTAP